jgi:hypothetical protein
MVKETGIIFDKPVKSDWLFWVWVGFSILLWISALIRVFESGGPSLSFYSIVSGSFDALIVGPISAFIIPVLPISLVRRLIRRIKK